MQLNKFGITNKIWDDLMKQNENIDIIQNALTGALFKNVSGQKDVGLSEIEATNGLLVFTGTLTDNVTVTVPNVPRVYHVQNQTSGDYTLTIKSPRKSNSPRGIESCCRSIYICSCFVRPRKSNSPRGIESEAGAARTTDLGSSKEI